MNCSRGAPLSQFNLRVAKAIHLGPRLTAELTADVFNVTNAINPVFNIGAVSSGAVYTGTLANHTPNSVFMKPNAFAGDSGTSDSASGSSDSVLLSSDSRFPIRGSRFAAFLQGRLTAPLFLGFQFPVPRSQFPVRTPNSQTKGTAFAPLRFAIESACHPSNMGPGRGCRFQRSANV